MAIDTAEKRKSISGISLPFFASGVTPNSSEDQEWRQESGWSYSGILATTTTLTWSWLLEAYISGAWVDISGDVMTRASSIIAQAGIEGDDITNRVASPGSLTCTLDNGESNSASKIGYYSLGHANQRANFGLDTPIRLKFVVNGTTYIRWRGYLENLEPMPNRFGKRTSYLTASDFMRKMIDHKLDNIPVQENKRPDQLVDLILDEMPVQPASRSLAVGSLTLPLALHSEKDESSTPMSVLQKICLSALEYAWVEADESFVTQRETTRSTQAALYTFDNTMSEIKIERNTERIKNKVVGAVFPSRVDTGAETLLASLSSEFPLDAGDTQTIKLRLRDPSGGSNRLSGKDFVTTLVADEHYKMSAFADSGGNDMNAYLSTVVTAGGNTVQIQVQNTGSVRGYISRLNIYGNGIYLYDPIDIVVESGSADKVVTYDLHYIADYQIGKDFITAMHKRKSIEHIDVVQVSYNADASLNMMTRAMSIGIGDRITLQEYVTGLDGDYTVNQIRYEITTTGRLIVEYSDLEWASGLYRFYTTEDPTLGEIDEPTIVLSPY